MDRKLAESVIRTVVPLKPIFDELAALAAGIADAEERRVYEASVVAARANFHDKVLIPLFAQYPDLEPPPTAWSRSA